MTWFVVIQIIIGVLLVVVLCVMRAALWLIRRIVVDPQIGDAEARLVIGRIVRVRR